MIHRTFTDSIFGRPGKRCPMCGRYLEHWQYNKSKTSKDGLQGYCKECQKKYRAHNPSKQYKQNRKDESLSLWND